MKLTLELPDEFSLMAEPEEMSNLLKLNTALLLYKQGKLTIGQACLFSGIDLYQFMQACHTNEISVIDYSSEDITSELDEVREIIS